MDFSLEKFGSETARYLDSGPDSDLELIFVPGLYNPEIWKHQVRYFSDDYRCVSFDIDGFQNQVDVIEDLLESGRIENAVVFSNGLGNQVAREVEYHENVVATVLTGTRKKKSRLKMNNKLHSIFWTGLSWKPKLFKKVFFSDLSSYRVAYEFLEDVDLPSFEEYKSFMENFDSRKPVKNCLLLMADDDRFNSVGNAEDMKESSCVAMIQNSGSFCFYEKPQDYNKATLDFLNRLRDFVESRKVSKAQEKNRSLREFEVEHRKEAKVER